MKIHFSPTFFFLMDIDFSKVKTLEPINKKFVLDRISDAQIFAYYHGQFSLGEVYCSKLRPDKTPSCGFYISTSGKLIYNDIAKETSYDCFAFVAALYNITFGEAVKKIASDFGLIDGVPNKLAEKAMTDLSGFDKTLKKETVIAFSPAKWDDNNLSFWKRYHITQDELERENIYCINDLFINEVRISKKDKFVRYAITRMVDGEMKTKVYTPGSDKFKWVSNIPMDCPFGLDTFKPTGFSFVTKSQKDRIVLKKFLGDAVIACQSEKMSAFPEKLQNQLKKRVPINYVGYDNDPTGLESLSKLEQNGFVPIHIPVEYREKFGLKDFSDLVKEHGLKSLESFLKTNKII